MSSTTMASRLFEDRHRGSILPAVKTRLDALQSEFQVKGEAVLVAWDCLLLNKKASSGGGATTDWPESEDSFQLLRRKLGEMVSKDSAKKDVNSISNASSRFKSTTVSPQSRGRVEKRLDKEFSAPSPKRAHVLQVERMSMVQAMQGQEYSTDLVKADHDASSPSGLIPVAPANEWTERCWTAAADFKYMHAPLTGITEELRHRITAFGTRVLESNRVKNPLPREAEAVGQYSEFCQDFDKVGAPVQGRDVVVLGWIVCEGENEKLALGNAMLEGVNGVRVKLSFSDQAKFSLYPGQYVVVEGVSTSRTNLLVKQIFIDDALKPSPSPTPTSALGALTMWTVAGPYTNAADLEFDLLRALLVQVKTEQPDVLLLLGPFVDCNHPLIASGQPTMQIAGETLAVDFVDVFSVFLQHVSTALEGTRTRVCLVPCTDDVTHNVVAFPQPPIELPEESANARITSLPNPAVVSLGASNIILGVANVDTLFDFQTEGSPYLGYNARENFPRLTSQLLASRSFYPIVPPAQQSLVDLSSTNEFDIAAPLHILLTPSKLQPFAQEEANTGTLCINPGRALTMKSKMTVCKLDVQEGDAPLASRARAEFFTVG